MFSFLLFISFGHSLSSQRKKYTLVEYNQLFFLFKNIILPGCDVIQGIIIARINIPAIIIRARNNNTLLLFLSFGELRTLFNTSSAACINNNNNSTVVVWSKPNSMRR